ncbi:hypothetical protein TNCV_3395111 [Trichonephila clavipes]|nr:hypothetical protein TNCV_3395111 [Trichonephila clavipes]
MRDSSVKTTSFHSATHILFSSHHWRRRRLWFCVKGRPSNGRLADRPLCCKRRRTWNTEVDVIDHVSPSYPPASNGHISGVQLFGFVQHDYRFT